MIRFPTRKPPLASLCHSLDVRQTRFGLVPTTSLTHVEAAQSPSYIGKISSF